MTTESLSVTIEGEVLTVEIGTVAASAGGGGSSDHGTLTGLADDDHAQYALADGSRGTFATAAQGALADTAVQPAAIATKLDDISAGTADAIVTASADGTLLSRAAYTIASLLTAAYARASHTGTQLASTISDFASAAISAVTWSTITGKPSTFPPEAHNQDASTITSGTLVHERGGLEADVSAYSGLVKIAAGATSAVTVTAAGEALLDDADAAAQRATLGLVIGTNVQAYDADLTTWAGVTPGTGIATALAVNVGTAGAPVINGGALGTPSSGTLTNCTGYPAASASASGIVELAIASEVDTGTDATRAMTPDSYRDSTPYYTDRTADWTLAQSDANTEQQFNSGSARVCTIDTNANAAISVGTIVPFLRVGSGSATIDAVAGVTINGVDGASVVISTQWQGALARKLSTNGWAISGDIA